MRRRTQTAREETVVKDPRDVIIRPVVSEKSYGLLDHGVYTFIVAPDGLQARDP